MGNHRRTPDPRLGIAIRDPGRLLQSRDWRRLIPGLKNCPLNAYKSVVKWHFVALQMTINQGDHSPDNVKFPDGSRHSAC